MQVNIYNLCIELTRRCNMACPHCLRGEAQNVEQKIEHVIALFSNIDDVSLLTLTGGEPSLAVAMIEKIIDCAHVYNVEIGSFYIATNGKKIMPRFVRAVERLHSFCTDNVISAVEVSNDIYHDAPIKTNGYEQLMQLEYCKNRWEGGNPFVDSRMKGGVFNYFPENLIEEGRALYSGVAAVRTVKPDTLDINEYDTARYSIDDGVLYLNCKGWLIAGCDFSFERQDNPDFAGRICHVNDFSIPKMYEYASRDLVVV